MQASKEYTLEEEFDLQAQWNRGLQGKMPKSACVWMMGKLPEYPRLVMSSEMDDARIANGIDGFLNSIHSFQGKVAVD